MNLQNKILIILFALGTIGWGCDSIIYDDLSECPQGVYVKFFSKTPCEVDSTFIGNVSDLHLFAFNENDVLVSLVTQQNAMLSKDFEVFVPVSNGYYTFVAWTGINEHFTLSDFKEGTTTKRDVMLILKSQNNEAAMLGETKIRQGASSAVFLQNPAEVGSQYKHTAINLREVTNRIEVEIELHESIIDDAKPEDFVIEIRSANGTMNIDGSLPFNNTVLNYPSIVAIDKNVKASFTLMDLRTGYSNQIVVKNRKTDEVIWQGDLLGSILLMNENINLACRHDFNVKFVIKDKCLNCGTYICWAIFVNNWKIHSYETEL